MCITRTYFFSPDSLLPPLRCYRGSGPRGLTRPLATTLLPAEKECPARALWVHFLLFGSPVLTSKAPSPEPHPTPPASPQLPRVSPDRGQEPQTAHVQAWDSPSSPEPTLPAPPTPGAWAGALGASTSTAASPSSGQLVTKSC